VKVVRVSTEICNSPGLDSFCTLLGLSLGVSKSAHQICKSTTGEVATKYTRQELTTQTVGYLVAILYQGVKRNDQTERNSANNLLISVFAKFLPNDALSRDDLYSLAAASPDLCSDEETDGVCSHFTKVGFVIQ
jgi:hypothetical protein